MTLEDILKRQDIPEDVKEEIRRNISERMQEEEALRENDERYRAIFENNSIAIAIIEPDTTISKVNDVYCKMGGYTEHEVVGMSWTQQIPPGDLERLKEYNRRRLINPQDAPDKYEFSFYHKNGEIRHALMSVALIQRSRKIITLFIDITERKRAEEALRKSEERFKVIFETISEGIALNEMVLNDAGEMIDYKILEVNDAFYEVADFNKGCIVIGNMATNLYGITPETIKSFWEIHKNSIETRCTEMISPRSSRIFNISTSPFKNNRFLTSFRDITEHKLAEQALCKSEEKFRNLFNTVPNGIIVWNLDGSVADANKFVVELLGFKFEEIEKFKNEIFGIKYISENGLVFPSENYPGRVAIRTGNSVKPVVIGVFPQKSNECRWMMVNSEPIKDVLSGKITASISTFLDISELKRIQDELTKYKEHLEEMVEVRNTHLLITKKNLEFEVIEHRKARQDLMNNKYILDSIADGVITIDINNSITSMNRSAELITGISESEIKNKTFSEVFPFLSPDLKLDVLFRDEKPVFNKLFYLKKLPDEIIPISLNASVLKNDDAKIKEIVLTFRDISPIEILHKEIEKQFDFHDIISKNDKMGEIFNILPDIAKSDSTVLIQGESGTGKELIAKAIFELSKRNKGPFITVNCAALPPSIMESELFGFKKGSFTNAIEDRTGKVMAANGGTLFFDEISELPIELQSKLLRLIENLEVDRIGYTKPIDVDVRIIAASNKDLRELVKQKLFREDLYFRINTIKIDLPPLRERKDDLPFLINHFIKKYNAKMKKNIISVSDDVIRILYRYEFPGNIRELSKIIEHAMVMCQSLIIEPQDLPTEIEKSTLFSNQILKDSNKTDSESPLMILKDIKETLRQMISSAKLPSADNEKEKIKSIDNEIKSSESNNEKTSLKNLTPSEAKEKIIQTIEKCQGNKTKAAYMLGINYTVLLRLRKKLGIL